jgi:hypothetical protein
MPALNLFRCLLETCGVDQRYIRLLTVEQLSDREDLDLWIFTVRSFVEARFHSFCSHRCAFGEHAYQSLVQPEGHLHAQCVITSLC